MKHPSSRELYAYWNLRRGLRAAPERADIEPGAIRRVLADTFILAFDEAAGHPFRVAGTRVCALFGRELKNESFLGLWSGESRDLVRDVVSVAAGETVGVIASAEGSSTDDTAQELELLVLPLRHRGRTDARILGALGPSGTTHWLGTAALRELTLGGLRYLGAGLEDAPPTAPARLEAKIRHGWVVYDGGQG